MKAIAVVFFAVLIFVFTAAPSRAQHKELKYEVTQTSLKTVCITFNDSLQPEEIKAFKAEFQKDDSNFDETGLRLISISVKKIVLIKEIPWTPTVAGAIVDSLVERVVKFDRSGRTSRKIERTIPSPCFERM